MKFDSIIGKALGADELNVAEVAALLDARDEGACRELYAAADSLKRELWGERVTYVVNLNLNWTNHCEQHCGFCNFRRDAGAPDAYRMTLDECLAHIARHLDYGITEVTMQGGLDPQVSVEFYYDLVRAVKGAFPQIHIHAFSPEEIFYLHERSGESPKRIIERLQALGLGSMPGTAAEILSDDVRRRLCAQKVTAGEWCDVVETAHRAGVPTTCTMMYGHIETIEQRAGHLLRLLEVQRRTVGLRNLFNFRLSPPTRPLRSSGACGVRRRARR
jgi:FO synthase subunit 2